MTEALQSLLADVEASAPFAWHRGRTVSRAEFLTDVEHLASRLPASTHVINVCRQRYAFIVAFVAAVLRGQVSLLSHDGTLRTMEQLRRRYPGVYEATDDPALAAENRAVYVDACGANGSTARYPPPMPLDRVLAVTFTSGTTGEPTPHEKTLRALRGCARLYVGELRLPADGGSVVATVPPQHMYGFEAATLVPLTTRIVVHSGHPLYPHDVRVALREVPQPRVLVTTPIHLRALVGAGEDLPTTDVIICAAAPLARSLAAEAEARFAARVMEVYGCTEAGLVATRRTTEGDLWTLPAGVSMTIDGERASIESKHAGRVPLQDSIERVSAREFRLLGRGADLVNIAGKRASLAGLDAILMEIDGVLDAGVFLSESERDEREPRLSAVVVAPTLTASDVKRELRNRIDAAFIPRDVYVVATLPRDRTGKLKRAALVEIARERRAARHEA